MLREELSKKAESEVREDYKKKKTRKKFLTFAHRKRVLIRRSSLRSLPYLLALF